MQKITVKEIVAATGGELLFGDETIEVSSAFHDSREVKAGCLFVAIPGERVDGHDYIEGAGRDGCVAVLVSRREWPGAEACRVMGMAAILTEDTVEALQKLAAWYLSCFPLVKVAVTGSTGKTSTKEMTYRILSEKYRTVRNPGNLNSPVGMSLSIFAVEPDTEAVVFEMGMDHLGEIRSLAEMVRPHVAIINNVGITHIGQLGSRENILAAKLEITDFLTSEDVLILNWDNDLLPQVEYKGEYQKVRVGKAGPDLFIEEPVDLGEKGITFVLRTDKETQKFHLPVPGLHNCYNAATAAAAGLVCGVSLTEAARGLEKLTLPGKRLHIEEKNGIKIIDDSYNASPDSMRAALDVLKAVEAKRKVVALADMFELGPESDCYHYQIGSYAVECGADLVLAVGQRALRLAEGAKAAGGKVQYFETREDLEKRLGGMIEEGDAVLVKGSRGMAMDRIVKLLEGNEE